MKDSLTASCIVSDQKCLALSVRQTDPESGDPSVNHYLIHRLGKGAGFYINPKRKFADLSQLMEFYSGKVCLFHCLILTSS